MSLVQANGRYRTGFSLLLVSKHGVVRMVFVVTGQLADTPACGLVSSRTAQVTDWTARGLVKSWTSQLATSQLAYAASNSST